MDKFGRNYQLFVQGSDGKVLEIVLPITLEFDITRKLLGSANHGSFRIYNLNKEHRNNLRFNNFNYSEFRSVKLYAGYGNNLSLIFSGNVHEAWSVREGVNFITQIDCFDCGFAFINTPFQTTFPAGTSQAQMITQIVEGMARVDPNVSKGAISNSYSNAITRANPTNGNAPDLLNDITGKGGFFADNGKVNCLQNNECLQGQVPIINSASGLLGTPLFEQGILSFDILFEPRLIIGQLILLQSTTETNFNGSYKITAIQHRGMISPAVCGDAITSVTCLTGVGQLQLVSA
jgi:hypothetical protein